MRPAANTIRSRPLLLRQPENYSVLSPSAGAASPSPSAGVASPSPSAGAASPSPSAGAASPSPSAGAASPSPSAAGSEPSGVLPSTSTSAAAGAAESAESSVVEALSLQPMMPAARNNAARLETNAFMSNSSLNTSFQKLIVNRPARCFRMCPDFEMRGDEEVFPDSLGSSGTRGSLGTRQNHAIFTASLPDFRRIARHQSARRGSRSSPGAGSTTNTNVPEPVATRTPSGVRTSPRATAV